MYAARNGQILMIEYLLENSNIDITALSAVGDNSPKYEREF